MSKSDTLPDVMATLTAGQASAVQAGVSEFTKVNPNKLRLTDIFAIQPDYLQPRRAIPHALRTEWRPNAQQMPDFLNHWISIAGIDPMVYFQESEDELPVFDDPAQISLIELIGLAASIRREGLLNPITLVKDESIGAFVIETGERRWLAYHLLHLLFGDQYKNIPSREMAERDVWRQASENSSRAPLNAIARARQLALLVMDMYGGTAQFVAFDTFGHELEFYAQVADGNDWRIPRGRGERLLAAMGLKNPQQLREYRALLRLPYQAWNMADDKNIPEFAIRQMVGDAKGDEQLLLTLIEKYTVSTDTVSPMQRPSPADDSDSAIDDDTPDIVSLLAARVAKQRGHWTKAAKPKKLSQSQKAELIAIAEAEREWLGNLISSLKL